MLPPHSITIRPPLAVVGEPSRAWHRTITIVQNERPVMILRPTLEVKASNGELMPVRLPWIHVPTAVRLILGQWRPVTISSTGHGIQGPEKLYLAFAPTEKMGKAGVAISAVPAARLIVGRYPGINHSTVRVSAPWIAWGTHATVATHIFDSGHTWFVPAVSVSAGGQTRSTALPPLLPGMYETSTSTMTLPTWGWSSAKVSVTGSSSPITRHIVSLPGLPIAIALGSAGMVELLNLVARKKNNQRRLNHE